MMRRREFLGLIAGGAAVSPFAAAAQSAPVVGYLMSRSPQDASNLAEAFRNGLRDEGFIDGQNVRVEVRWGYGRFDRLPELANELARIPVAVLAATGGEPAGAAAQSATTSIPIVFGMGGDPIRMGLAKSFNRPGGNATGVHVVNTQLEPKRFGILHDLVPDAKTIAVLSHTAFPSAEHQLKDVEGAAAQLGLSLRVFRISASRDIDEAFRAATAERISAMAVTSSPFFDTVRSKIIILSEHYRIASIYQFREYTEAGGLMSYGIDIEAVHRQVGAYAGQILKGVKPSELPILVPSKFVLSINLKTAKAIGLEIPATLLARADEVIE